jgi:hypothetical protein
MDAVELLNRGLRPGSIAALITVGVLFLAGLATVILYRYAVHGEIDWQGLAAFCTMVLIPYLQHAQNRHNAKIAGVPDRPLAEPSLDGLVNPHAVA